MSKPAAAFVQARSDGCHLANTSRGPGHPPRGPLRRRRPFRCAVLVGLVAGLLPFGGAVPASAQANAGWSVVASPNAGPASSANSLLAVSCVAANYCTAVGDYRGTGNGYLTLVEHWDGARWSLVASPNEGGASATNILSGVSCVSTRSCTAVGQFNNKALVEHWDGTRWSLVAVPFEGPASGGDVLNSVSCTSAGACTAVGYYDNSSGHSRTLVLSWDGTKWSVVTSPDKGPATAYNSATGATHDLLNGVSCASATSCAAVGLYVSASGDEGSLVEQWDGKAWSVVTSPDEGSASNSTVLNAVSCASSRSCAAVGNFLGNSGGSRTLIESWDGAKWSVVTSPDKGRAALDNNLAGVSCASTRSCVAVGNAGSSPVGGGNTLVEPWDGAAWSVVPSPDLGQTASGLAGVSCLATTCVAVGAYEGADQVYKALVETS